MQCVFHQQIYAISVVFSANRTGDRRSDRRPVFGICKKKYIVFGPEEISILFFCIGPEQNYILVFFVLVISV